MKPLREVISLNQPLRDVREVLPPAPPTEEQILARCREEYNRGFREGQKALGEQLLQQRSDVLALQNGVLNSLRQTLPQLRGECEGALVELALEVAQKIVSGVPISRELVEAAVTEALANVEDAHDISVLLHRDDLELLQRANSPMLLNTVGGERLNFAVSPEVTPGGCLVHTRFGVVDARRETKFDLLQRSLNA